MKEHDMVLRGDRGGFALPMAILVIGFLTASVMAAFARTGAEVRIVDNQAAQLRAFTVASAGLEQVISLGRITPASSTIAVEGDTAIVQLTLMHSIGDTSVYLVRSTSRVRGGVDRPQGSRTVAQLAHYVVGRLAAPASWTSISGLIKQGSSGIISGHDACSDDVVAGVAVPKNDYDQHGVKELVFGAPAVKDDIGDTEEEMAANINIDWASIVDPVAPSIRADYVVCYPGSEGYDANRGPCVDFPPPSAFDDPNYWPTVVINGSTTLPGDGRGTVITTGNLTLGGNRNWNGIIMVGGILTDNGSGHIEGAVLSGLNVKLGEPVGASSKANGTKDYIYNSCHISAAMAGMARLSQIPNAWSDNWSTW